MGSDLIAALDDALAQVGEDATLRRVVGQGNNTQNSDVAIRAKFGPVPPEKLVDGITQADFEVILSPTQILAHGWPGGNTAPPINPNASWLPQVNDKVLRQATGRWHNVKVPPRVLAPTGEVVRIELIVAG